MVEETYLAPCSWRTGSTLKAPTPILHKAENTVSSAMPNIGILVLYIMGRRVHWYRIMEGTLPFFFIGLGVAFQQTKTVDNFVNTTYY